MHWNVGRRVVLAATACLVGLPVLATAQVRSAQGDTLAFSIEDAIDAALNRSQEMRLARSQVRLAETQVSSARSGAFPQLDARVLYTRTFASPFQMSFTLPDSLRFSPDSTKPIADRVKYLEDKTPLAGLGGLGSLFSGLPFGQENSYTAALSGSQPLYTGGRLGSAIRIANEFLAAARLGLKEQTADIELQVRSSYYRARLARELVDISQAALEQAQRFLKSEQLRCDAGAASELDVLRAQVAVANLEPQVIQATSAAELATLDLKRLTDVPMARPITLTTALDVPSTIAAVDTTAASRQLSERALIAAQERQVHIREAMVGIARSGYMPNVNLLVNVGRQIYPSGMFKLNETWRKDYYAAVSVSLPIFHGGKTRADVAEAQVAVEQERLRLSQLREAVQLGYQSALGERERARSSIAARQLTVQQAQRVYDLTVMRYEQGLASQLEVSDARLGLLSAKTNLAQAAADFHIANANLARALGAPMSQ